MSHSRWFAASRTPATSRASVVTPGSSTLRSRNQPAAASNSAFGLSKEKMKTLPRVERASAKLATAFQVLRRREVFAKNSSKWGDPRAKLLDGEAWEQAKPTVLASLGLPERADEHLAARAALLHGTYREVAARLPDNSQIVFDTDGRLHFAAHEAFLRLGDPPTPVPEPFATLLAELTDHRPNMNTATNPNATGAGAEPASLLDLRAAVNAMLPRVDLPEVLLEVSNRRMPRLGLPAQQTPKGERLTQHRRPARQDRRAAGGPRL